MKIYLVAAAVDTFDKLQAVCSKAFTTNLAV